MNFFNFNIRKIIFILLLLPLPLITINMEQKPVDTNWLARPFYLLARGFQEFFFEFSYGIKNTTAHYVNLINLKQESQDLKNKNSELSTRLQQMTEMELENARLKQLLDFKQNTKMELIAAQVTGRDLISDHHTLTINKGTNHGLKVGQAVITTEGALGYIFRPSSFSSHIMLITDRYAVVDGVIQRTRARGIVEGKSSSECTLKIDYVERSEDVKLGDLVVTGGLDNIFPKGFPIAVVQSVERKTFSVSLKVELKPIVNPYKVEEVFIVMNAANEDMSTQQTTRLETETNTL